MLEKELLVKVQVSVFVFVEVPENVEALHFVHVVNHVFSIRIDQFSLTEEMYKYHGH